MRRLIDARFNGSQAEFAKAIRRSPAQVHQWLTGHRKLGDAGSRHIEIELKLPTGYFGASGGRPMVLFFDEDGRDSVGTSPGKPRRTAAELARAINALPENVRVAIWEIVDSLTMSK